MADEIKYLGVEAGQALAEQIKKKQNKLIPGAGISIEGNTISASIDAGTLATKEELNDYAKKADVYTKEEADGKFLTEHQSLDDYAKKTDIPTDFYSKDEVDSAISDAKSELLGGAGNDYDTLKKIQDWVEEHQDLYTALVSTIGEKADADDVYTKDEVDEVLEGYVTADDVYTKDEVDAELAKKADAADVYTKTEADGKFLTEDDLPTFTAVTAEDVAGWLAED